MPTDNEFFEQLQARLAADPTVSWTAEETSISRLTEEERRKRLGYVPGPQDLSLEERERRSEEHRGLVRSAAAGEWNWTNVDGSARSFIDPVRDQKSCGSCVAFGVTATIEGAARIAEDIPYSDPNGNALPQLSPAQLFYCGGSMGCQHGWYPDAAFDYAENTGVVPEWCFPYTPGNQPCNLCDDWRNQLTIISGYSWTGDPVIMKDWLTTTPLTTCFTVYDDFHYYAGGVYRHTSGGRAGGHCVCVVGYSDNEQAWLCKNQWNTGWGQIPRFENEEVQPHLERGYFKIAYGECGIDAMMWKVDGFNSIYTQ
ncbi:dipeptidyl-peptidase I [Micromonospora sp. ATCC 39149]|uniref:Peptidase n=1 Tax=Micromonospora carbonacea TaxID=47853 RepID=A0A7D6CFR0_9ACTN|nr:C1 family peptidase [Micromonospora sp. ATCC 39149]EEP72349.1 dipeptidyl-peptidase I [Micromonospora sp. ATCC 39149]QLJ98511.1 peptidase [Micromonospora carbonacea]